MNRRNQNSLKVLKVITADTHNNCIKRWNSIYFWKGAYFEAGFELLALNNGHLGENSSGFKQTLSKKRYGCSEAPQLCVGDGEV